MDILNQKPLTKLNTALLFLDFEKTALEPEYEAMGRMTKEHFVIQTRYQYSQDLVRALTEAKLTSKLRSDAKSVVSIKEKTFEPEELITYYDGIFLDYIHQIKDKVFRLTWWMLQDEKSKTFPKEPEKIGLKNLKIYYPLLKKMGIFDLFQEWDQNAKTGIAVALRKRTQHHHRVSNLQLNTDFQNIKMTKSMLVPASAVLLTEFGKNRLKEVGEESYKRWETDIASKHLSTLKLVENNLNSISSKLIEHFSLPIRVEDYARVINEYSESQKKFDVVNKSSVKKIPDELNEALDFFVSSCKEFFNNHLISIYLVGSIPRGEYIHNSSDINIIVITDFDSNELSLKDGDPRLNVLLFSEKEFLTENAKKYRFICWSDGTVLYGKEFKFDKREFPKPGTFLTLLLNRGFIDDLIKLRDEVKKLKKPSDEVMHRYSVKAARIMLHYAFGVAMANKPYYSSSIKEEVEYITKMFPSEKKMTLSMRSVYFGGLIKQENFSVIVDNFIKNETPSYEKMLGIEKNILDESASKK